MDISDGVQHMHRALALARNALNTADPNPRVGCVLVKDGVVVGEGWTARVGGPHAERVAIENAGAQARGATAYVTLEPCNHSGRTGPCTDALIAAEVARVVCAVRDPNTTVAGGGIEALESAGIEVEVGVLEAEARAVNPGFWMRMGRGRPLVRSKLAVSLDGRTALANGKSQWITSAEAREDVHRWRARSSAVMTGIGTIIADDPSLNARLAQASVDIVQPSRIIVDSQLRTPENAKTLSSPGERLIFTTQAESDKTTMLVRRGVSVERVGGAAHCDLNEVMARLGALEFNEVWVEAGPGLNGALLRAGLIDELVIYVAPLLLGSASRGMFELGELTELAQCPRLSFDEIRAIGPDLRIIATPANVP
ncbi:MAG: bifunctional diaminohydroxyphosphoribosylaminopyrimidine deaminase/5-amino-6-(5-phosphoribosylamino)uracil reductase RibD [Gammaproteobacteria bacterium]|nr:bifunctional diaminohydroxyphosphoribosylaminopyrimidine deaminase/5-amino-6-(5-phosphoribosylamino)uracil reductase RibD [Gammaproteobacteria bacterium]MDH3506520.1 bifunctional diaminohydroxyphosphoribosylaminopyrimidine deaminase/5-amino-6-(5-phosphoribosylamino)uracil reductase RibD [Gammaproteobacteria bacterium]